MQTIELVEYESRRTRAAAPTAADLNLAERLTATGDVEARLDVRWLADGRVDVKASSWVGVVRFTDVEIRVVPKLVGGPLQLLQMIEYSDGVRLLAHLPPDQRLALTGADLFELIVRLLMVETKLLIRDGLLRDYRPVEDTLTVMRGRLRVREQFLNRYGILHRLECTFDEYDGDIPENQLLAVALAVSARHVGNRRLRNDTRVLSSVIGEICEPHSRDADWYESRIHYGRRNSRYKTAHELALLVLRGLFLEDLHNAATSGVTAFMINMNAVFERFVSALIGNALAETNLTSTTQLSIKAVIMDESTNRTYSNIRPDLVIADSRSGRTIPIDIKYKLYDTTKFSSADVYQLFTYAYALAGNADERIAGVIYAASGRVTGPALRIKPMTGVKAARLRGTGLDVAAVLDELSAGSADAVHTQVRNLIQDITGLSVE